jgi:proliferating cell nuclear antigen
MTKLVLSEAIDFKKSIEAISVLINEAEFVLSKEGLSLKAADPSQISMVDFKMDKKAFKEFVVDQETRIGLDLDYLSQVMSRGKPKEELVLELNTESSRLDITFKGKSNRRFSVPLIDISSSELPSPKIEFDSHLKIKADVLQDALKDVLLVSSHVSVGVTAKSFYVKASSSKGEVFNETEKSEKALIELNAKKEAEAMFPLDYLNDMLKSASSDTVVELSLKSNNPVKISYNIGKAEIVYFLAPRIETQ